MGLKWRDASATAFLLCVAVVILDLVAETAGHAGCGFSAKGLLFVGAEKEPPPSTGGFRVCVRTSG